MSLIIGILSSGNLGFITIKRLNKLFNLQFIFTDKNSVEIIEFSKMQNIPIFIGNPRNNNPDNFLKQFKTDILLSINYLFIVEKNILNHPQFYAINLHGSLLPKYRGRTPHIWAIINGEKETGVTAHIMDEGFDTGDIVLQKRFQISEDYTGADILNKFKRIYPNVVLELIKRIEYGKLEAKKQDNKKATHFGKRTPKDGQINWNWQKERIYNWIRALAFPYPGAFTRIRDQKVIIDKICFSDYGFEDSISNGLILKVTPKILVKTPNGVVEILIIRSEQISFKVNDKFESQCK